jgi:hypothetical protein
MKAASSPMIMHPAIKAAALVQEQRGGFLIGLNEINILSDDD